MALPCIKSMKETDCKEAIEQWSYNLYNMETMNTPLAFATEKPIFMKMAEVANFPQMSTEQQQIYMRSLNNYRTVLATKDYDYNMGSAEGRAEGRAEGHAEEKLAIAANLLSMGMSIEQVVQATGLSTEEVNSL